MSTAEPVNRIERLRATYAAFNARDIDAVLATMTDDVDWPNAWEGGRLVGHQAIRDYWTRQWAEIDGRVDPVQLTERPDGSIAVEVHQVVHSLGGALLEERNVLHVYEFDGDLVTRMDVEPAT
jgi:hypothetical protein